MDCSPKPLARGLVKFDINPTSENAAVEPRLPYLGRRAIAGAANLEICGALLIYITISLLIYGLPLRGHFTTSYVGVGADPTIFLWAIAWWPHAILHGINPFLTTAIWAPKGANLAWATSIPGPSLLMTPITMLWGPVVSYNILNILCPLANGFSMFLLCRYVAKSFWPALLGGLIFAFSPYAMAQSMAHIFLLFIFPVPLAILLVLRRMNGELRRATLVVLLTIVLAFEFLSSTELFATTSVFGTFLIVLAYLICGGETRRALQRLLPDLAITYASLIVVLSPYLYYVFAQGVPGPINPGSEYSNDLLALFIPTPALMIGGHIFDSATAMMGGWWEMSGYLGPGLLVMVALFVIAKWREPVGKLLTVSLALIAILSLGPILHVRGTPTIPMPWWVFSKLPLTNQALPGRFGMYMYLAAALMAAIVLSETKYPLWFAVGLAIVCLAFLAPSSSRVFITDSEADQPLLVRSERYRQYIAPGDNVLFLPHGGESMSLLWQAESGFYYNIATGRVGMTPPTSAGWPILQSFDSDEAIGGFVEELEAFLGANHVNTIVVEEGKQHHWPALLAKLQLAPVAVDGVLLYRVSPAILNSYATATPHEIARREALASVAMLIGATNRYLSSGSPLAKLTPWNAQRLKALDLPEPIRFEDADNNWWHNLWLGPMGKADVGIGIFGRFDDLEPVIKKFGPYANHVLFPYPRGLKDPGPDESGQLLLIFDREGIEQAAVLKE